MIEERIFFDCEDIKLEGALTLVKGDCTPPGVVLCHPHPLYGGNMHSSLIINITRILSKHGFITLRFNFRGVGYSEGSYGGGIEEAKDVKAAIDFIEGVQPQENNLFLVGYSFGAMVGLQVAENEDSVCGWVGISPPVAMYDFSFLKKSNKPKLIIYGSSDFVCPGEEMKRLFSSLNEPKSLTVIPGTDHFFLGKEDTIAENVKDFLCNNNKQ